LEEEIMEQKAVKERPKKRRKTEQVIEDVDMVDADAPGIPPDGPDSAALEILKSPTLPAALPRFPLPTLPNAPSKSDLALQGLDKALVDAEIIDPTTSLAIPSDAEDDTVTGLSERMRKRLTELGICELFAGLWLLGRYSSIMYTDVKLNSSNITSPIPSSGKPLKEFHLPSV
jgi:ATP-dependent RNA helicase DDX51/DBP6